MRLRPPDRGERGERGAIAVMTAFLMVVLLAAAALAVDITTQVNVRQKLYDTVDAAAQAGAYRLPSSGPTAASDARANALKNDPTLSLPTSPVNAVTFFCVVASKLVGGIYIVDNSQIPATCNPLSVRGGSSPNWTWTGSRCNSKICGIPCNGANDVCNTIKVTGSKTVPFAFAPAIGITAPGSTGSVSSVACKGVCGTIPLNPMDVAVVADRTPSMSSTDINAMINGIKGMFQWMTPSQQYVALGTIGRSKLNAASTDCTSSLKALSEPSTSATAGPWVPVPFSDDYLNADKTPNDNNKLVDGVTCLKNQSSATVATHLASPMKYAARYLLGYDNPNDILLLPARTGTVRKAIIFETDGQPRESAPTGGDTLLTTGDVFSNTERITPLGLGSPTKYYFNGGHQACENMKDVAAKAKAEGVLVVTIAYNLGGKNCDENDNLNEISTSTTCLTTAHPCLYSKYATPTKVTDALAAAASNSEVTGEPSIAQNDCTTQTKRDAENVDQDYFFCAVSGTVMAPIYKTALGQLAKGIRLMRLP